MVEKSIKIVTILVWTVDFCKSISAFPRQTQPFENRIRMFSYQINNIQI